VVIFGPLSFSSLALFLRGAVVVAKEALRRRHTGFLCSTFFFQKKVEGLLVCGQGPRLYLNHPFSVVEEVLHGDAL